MAKVLKMAEPFAVPRIVAEYQCVRFEKTLSRFSHVIRIGDFYPVMGLHVSKFIMDIS